MSSSSISSRSSTSKYLHTKVGINVPLYDNEQLIDTIIKDRIRLNELKDEYDRIRVQVEEYEGKCKEIKQKVNISRATEEIRYINQQVGTTANDTNDTTNSSNNTANDSNFKLLNRKIEIRIFIDEIKTAIPSLELAIAMMEKKLKQLHSSSNHTNTNTDAASKSSRIPSILMLDDDELTQSLVDAIEAKLSLKVRKTIEMEKKKQESKALDSAINVARQNLLSLLDDREAIKEAKVRMHRSLIEERSRIDVLLMEQKRLRMIIDQYYSGNHGWETESFASATGSSKGLLDKASVIKALTPWVSYVLIDKANGMLTSEYRNYDSFDLDTYCKLCDALLEDEREV